MVYADTIIFVISPTYYSISIADTPMLTAAEIARGQESYTPATLRIYGPFVLGFSNSLIWKHPSSDMLETFNERITPCHLDVGVGDGYFLNRQNAVKSFEKLHLFDLSPHSLEYATKVNSRFNPVPMIGDVYSSEDVAKLSTYDSISLQYLIHCVPGLMPQKAEIFANLSQRLNENGILFGATILPDLPHGFLAKKLMAIYNKKRIFSNEQDTVDGLKQALSKHLEIVSFSTRGCVASFVCQKK